MNIFFSLCMVLMLCVVGPQSHAQGQDVAVANLLTGRYRAAYSNTDISSEIIEAQNFVTGYFFMDGERYQIVATRSNNGFQGKIVDEGKRRFYDVSSQLNGDTLHFAITFPESANRVVELRLKKISNGSASADAQRGATPQAPAALNQRERNPRLVGTWRYTEVLSSGTSGNFASLATDHFIQLKANGECLSWSGRSAGGAANVSVESQGSPNVFQEEWYTDGSNIVFLNPRTKAEKSIAFLADARRFMLKGRSNKVYQRVQ